MNFKLKDKIPYQTFLIFYCFISAVLRITLWALYGSQAKVSSGAIPGILIFGLVQDLVTCAYILLPVSLFQLLPSKLIYSNTFKIISAGIVFAVVFFTLFLFPTEILFFDEFSARFNLVAVDYFAYPTEVFGNIWESYPIVWFVCAILIAAMIVWWKLWPRFAEFFDYKRAFSTRLKFLGAHAAFCLLFILFGSIDILANHSNRVQSQIVRNGILTFAEAFYTNELEFDHYYAQLDEKHANQIMREQLLSKGGEFVSDDPANITRRFKAKDDGLGKLNVVIIGEESLGAQYIGALGDKRGLTPNFDKLSKKGLLFENAYATGTRTVRGLEAITMSFPPIPSESTVKRTGNENMANLSQVLNNHGYSSSFLYGGFGAFDNMNYFFSNNGFEISDRTDVKNVTFSNIWGICDEDLFTHAINYFDEKAESGKPFFSLIMTTSNHKPFTFPSGIPGITPSGGGREMGVKYADYAIGQFFKMARTKKWYKNTLFVVVGDHDSRVYGRAHIPVERFKVALTMFSPKKLFPRKVPNVTSQIDIVPTILGILGLSYEAPFYGRDILAPGAPLNQAVIINHNHDVGLFDSGTLAVTGINKNQRTFKYTEDFKTVAIDQNIDMQNMLTAYLQTAYKGFKQKSFVISNKEKDSGGTL